MNLQFITQAVGAATLVVKEHAPTLMVVGGVVSMGASVVTASRKTLTVEQVLEPHVEKLELINDSVGKPMKSPGPVKRVYTTEMARQDRFKMYTKTALVLGKHYAVPGVLFVGGACLVFGGHRMLLQRNAALTIAFTTLQRAFDKYRHNARSAMGEEFDQAMISGFVHKEVIDDDGKVQEIQTRDWETEDMADPYARVFEQGESQEWRPDLGMNKHFIEMQRKYAQEKLNRKGYLFLSDVYESLGFEETPISRLVGWKVTRHPDGSKEYPHVDFGLDKRLPDDWKYSQEHAIYLDFNCKLIIGGDVQKALEKVG